MANVSEPPDATVEPVIQEVPDPPVKVSLRIEDWLSVLILAGLACITFANVLVRYLTNESIAWTEEISVFLMIVLTMTAGATAFFRNQHIRIEYFSYGGTEGHRRTLALIVNSLVLFFFLLLAVLSARMAYDNFIWGDTTPAIGLPMWWYSVWMPVLSIAISLRIAGILRRLLRGGK
jgi:TRAP-type C4-dicarboxylate transport system permease small subunit